MKGRPRWDQCVDHKDGGVPSFINEYFSSPDRCCLLIAGAGFDPRTPSFCKILYDTLNARLHVILIREERPNPDVNLVKRADHNLHSIQSLLTTSKIIKVDIFAEDNAIVGGRNVISELRSETLGAYTDIVIDLSALSIGVSFPIVRFMYESAQRSDAPLNVHLLVASDPGLDHIITPISSDVVNKIHGFKGGLGFMVKPNLQSYGYRSYPSSVKTIFGEFMTRSILMTRVQSCRSLRGTPKSVTDWPSNFLLN